MRRPDFRTWPWPLPETLSLCGGLMLILFFNRQLFRRQLVLLGLVLWTVFLRVVFFRCLL
jgi:hypothetical protein